MFCPEKSHDRLQLESMATVSMTAPKSNMMWAPTEIEIEAKGEVLYRATRSACVGALLNLDIVSRTVLDSICCQPATVLQMHHANPAPGDVDHTRGVLSYRPSSPFWISISELSTCYKGANSR